MPGKYKDLIMDVATEEMGHVEMIATMVARLLEGAPATATTKAATADRWSARCWAGWTRSRPSWPAAARC
jgi:Mn-containing catalase